MNQEKGEVVWRDRRITIFLIFFISLIIPIFAVYVSLFLYKPLIVKILFAIGVLSFFVVFFAKIMKFRISVSIEGILMDDIIFIEDGQHIPKEKRVFISWSAINSLKIIRRFVRGGYIKMARPFLIVKTKKRTCRYGLVNVKGFIRALKKLNKFNLLDKESRRKYGE